MSRAKTDIPVINRSSGDSVPCRSARSTSGLDERRKSSIAPIPPRFSALLPTPETTGDFEEMCLIAGESTGLVKDIKPAGQIVQEMMEEARQVIERLIN